MNCCSKCRTLSEGSVCPECGGTKMFIPEPKDAVFLAECDVFSGDILEGMLEKRNIPVTKNVDLKEFSDDGMTVIHYGRDKFYVPYADHEEAMAVIKKIYGMD